jgi:hypothetical protein
MHFLFSLLRIKGLYMFGVLLSHPQEALHKHARNIPSAVFVAPHEDDQVTIETCTGP